MELVCEKLRAVVLPQLGGRVENLYFDEQPLMTDQTVHPDNWGSTFWPSPQSAWGWPPLAVLDSCAYKIIRQSSQRLELLSDAIELQGVSFNLRKIFSVGSCAAHPFFCASYALLALTSGDLSLACWEITRVPGGGISFFERGEMQLTTIAPHQDLVGEEIEEFLVYDHRRLHTGAGRKVHAHTRGGFLAHLEFLPEPRLILKVFAAIEPEQQAPGEGVVELFYNACGGYIELEVQGAYQALNLEISAQLQVRTFVLKPPSVIDLDNILSLARWTRTFVEELNLGEVV